MAFVEERAREIERKYTPLIQSPHHKRLESFPHHKHIGEQAKRVTSYEVCLEDVIAVLEKEMARPR